MDTTFVGPDDPRWGAALAALPHDFYHLPGYVRLEARRLGGEPVAFLADRGGDRFLLPLILRPIDPGAGGEGLLDAVSPYGYPGPSLAVAPGGDAEAFLGRAVAGLVAGLRERRAVSAFVRAHPLLPLPEAPLAAAGALVRHGETVSVDLTLPDEELWRQTRSGHRTEINKAAREGQVARIDDDAYAAFESIYRETMDRLGAADAYYFTSDYIAEFRRALGERLHLGVVEIEGQVACAALFTEVCGIVQYHLSGTRAAFHRRRPTKTLLHFARGWAKGRGNRVLHLGGGLGGQADALFDFKAGFSKRRHPFSTLRLVVDEAAYRALTDRWRDRAGVEADRIDGYFPAYRKPVG